MKKVFHECKTNQKGSALIFTLMVTTILLILAASMISVTATEADTAVAQEKKKTAQYVAEGALERAKRQMFEADTDDDPSTSPLEPLHDFEIINGVSWEYRCTKTKLSSDPDQYRLDVHVNNSNSDAVKDLRVIVEMRYNAITSTQVNDVVYGVQYDEVETAGVSVFTQALVLGLNGGNTINLNGELEINGSLYSNSSIDINSGKNKDEEDIKIKGDVSSAGSVTGDIEEIRGNIKEDQPLITLPIINTQYIYEQALKEHTTFEPKVFNQSVELSSESFNDGKVYYINGDLTIVGEISGSVLIYATGNIIVDGDIEIASDQRAAGLFAGENIYFTSNHPHDTKKGHEGETDGPEVHGLVIAGGKIDITGECEIKGTVIADGLEINRSNQIPGELEIDLDFKNHENKWGNDNNKDGQKGNNNNQGNDKKKTPAEKLVEEYGTQIISNYSSLTTTTILVPRTTTNYVSNYVYSGGELQDINYQQWDELN